MSKKDACKRKRLMNIAIIDERNDAAATGEKIISITECVKQQQYRFSSDNETVGIITPTYAWGLPSIVRDFCMRLCWRIPRPICGFSPHTEQARDKLDVLPTKSCSAKSAASIYMPNRESILR